MHDRGRSPLQRHGAYRAGKYPGQLVLRFVVMQRFLSYQNEISMSNTLIINIYFLLKNFSLSEEKEYAIDDSDVVLEKYPLIISPIREAALVRVP